MEALAAASSVEKLEMLTRDLDVGLQKRGVKRKWTCLKKVVKEKKIQSYWAEVERAKSMLLLYQGLRNGYVGCSRCWIFLG